MIGTSGRGKNDLTMLAIPLALLIIYALYSGGGVSSVLRTLERTLWAAVAWVGQVIS